MKYDALLQLDAQGLIHEIDNTAEGEPGALRDVAVRVFATVENDLASVMSHIRHLKEQRASQHPGQSPEDARRRLENAKLVTPYPVDRARSLIAKRIELREDLSKVAQDLFVVLAKLEVVEAELAGTREVLVEREKLRELHRVTGLYAGSTDFLSRLHENHRIDWKDLDALTEDDEREIAEVVLRRYRAAREQPPAGQP